MHIPVLKKEVLEYFNPRPNENFIDCTAGYGGHSLAILEKNKPNGKVLAIERDPEVFNKLKERNISRLALVNDSYINLEKIIEKNKIKEISGILFDLGMSSYHIDHSKRGFSFLKNEKLDMRYSALETDITAWDIVNKWDVKRLQELFKKYGEEKHSLKIAKEIISRRTINTTFDLVEAIKKAVPSWGRLHVATRVFQALRIEVNKELDNLEKTLPRAISALSLGGKLIVISFHSLEDRIVKNFFKSLSKEEFKILTKKPIMAGESEVKENPRARSAKLRVVLKTCKTF